MADAPHGTAPLARGRSKSIPKQPSEMPAEQDLIAFSHVAAGHEGISSDPSGLLVIKPCTQAEIDFYEASKQHERFLAHMPTFMGTLALNLSQSVAMLAPASAQHGQHGPGVAVPTAGTFSIPAALSSAQGILHRSLPSPISSKRTSWKPSGGKKLETGMAVVLENIAAGFTHPNILDVKLGARLWADDAPVAKRRKLDDVSRETTSGSLGFRIAGMKLWHGDQTPVDIANAPELDKNIEIKDGYFCYTKQYGRTFTAENARDGFVEYLGGLDPTGVEKVKFKRRRANLVARRMLRELQSLEYVLEHQESRMYSASILMVYEGDEEAMEMSLKHEVEVLNASDDTPTEEDEDDGSEDDEGESKVEDVRMIDFAHASWTPGLGPDENVLQGVRSMIKIMEELVRLGA